MQNKIINEDIENDFQLRALIDEYASHWRWFVLAVILSLIGAYVYLRYTTPQYLASTTILIKDEKKSGVLAAFSDMGLDGSMKNNMDNEITILQSRTLIQNTAKKLNLNIAIISKGKFIDSDLYGNAPFDVKFLSKKDGFYQSRAIFKFKSKKNDSFSLDEREDISKFIINKKEVYKFGEVIHSKIGDFVIQKTTVANQMLEEDKYDISIIIKPIEEVANSLNAKLNISQLSKQSKVIQLTLVDPVIKKSEDFLDNLVEVYNNADVSDKNLIYENTSNFIAKRLALITSELDGVEQDVESFKKSNKLIDIETDAQTLVTGSTGYDQKRVEVEIQLNVINTMTDLLRKSSNSDLIPTNLITGEGDASSLINSYNQLILDRNRILKSATTENPSVIKMDQQIASLRGNILSSLNALKSSLNVQIQNLKNKEGQIDSKIQNIPNQERQFRAIARQQKVKEELYLYLLQKREETAIALSGTETNARVIDKAKASKAPVSPKKRIIYFGAFLLGLLIPFSIIYLMDLLDTKIKSRLDIEGKVPIPFIGDIPTSEDSSQIMKSESRSSSAEALRIIRTNLDFMVNTVPEGKAKTIFLTSTFPKEGKTFVSVNLAATFALSGKKVLLIGMDIRNPRLDEYVTLPEKGFTNYLSSTDLRLEDLIVKYKGYEDFHILPAGAIPPNPAELLMSKKVESFFETIKNQFDYIIVDTAPVSLVTDTLLIAKYADCFVYVARANFLEKRMLNIPVSLYNENKLPNMCILLNDTDTTKGYGYGYGYGIKVEKKPWYKRILKS